MTIASRLDVHNISKGFGKHDQRVTAIADLSLSVEAGSFVSIIGPSGCGKSTLFSLLVGLDQPDSGLIEIDSVAERRLLGRSAYMPQADALLPWLKVIDNVGLGLTGVGVPRKKARVAAQPLLERFGLAEFSRAYPSQLSGGMRQRVAFLRTVLTGRPILLLDEPFGALDSVTRHDMQTWLADVWATTGTTVVLVTHDVAEAVYLSDVVHVMTARPGRVHKTVQVRLPRPRPSSLIETKEFAEYETLLRRELRIVATSQA